MATKKLPDAVEKHVPETHEWLQVTGAVALCPKCRVMRRYSSIEGRFPISEYLTLEGDHFIMRTKAGSCTPT